MAKKDKNPKAAETEPAETPDPQDNPGAEETPAPETSELDRLREENCTLNDRLLRTLAEYDNYRKRSAKERDAIFPEAVAGTVAQFLAVADSIDLALSAPCTDVEFRKGIVMTQGILHETLAKLGVTEIEAAGAQFDPSCHNAVMHVEDESAGENTVVEVLQKGYRLGDRIIRFSMVKVAN